ncbi:MAG: glycoside hydrolase [Kiritimatiellae bacterium]|nr:glycoside hydrolase [Kiritimatiellia bacterium]
MTTNAQTVPLRWFLALALGAAAAAGVGAADAVVVQSAANGYNSWPIVQAIGSKVVCAYSRGTAHDISQGVRGVYARTSTDGGATWGDEVTVANDASCGEVAIGKGLDANGAMLLWVRCWGGANPHHDLYRTTDGVAFEKIATPALDPVPMQITDVFAVPGVGLMCLWFSDGYAASSVRAWGKLVSADNGLTWTRTTIETNLTTEDWPTEPAGVWLGDGKILVVARCEGANRQFQIVSTDSGATWTKRSTNITDVYKSTPSLVLDPATGLLSNYYYERGAKKLKRRVAVAADIFARPEEWPSPELLYTGEETVDIDAGNVNVTVLVDGRHLATTYTGTSSHTKIVAIAVAAPTSAEEKQDPTSGDVDLPPAGFRFMVK